MPSKSSSTYHSWSATGKVIGVEFIIDMGVVIVINSNVAVKESRSHRTKIKSRTQSNQS